VQTVVLTSSRGTRHKRVTRLGTARSPAKSPVHIGDDMSERPSRGRHISAAMAALVLAGEKRIREGGFASGRGTVE